MIKKINKNTSWSYEKINTIGKPLGKPLDKEKSQNTQITKNQK